MTLEFSSKKQYKVIVAYDGTGFAGWMKQKKQLSILQILEESFYQTFKKSIAMLGASKTDAGVHAIGQVATFSVDLSIDSKKMKWAWNNALPGAIVIRDLELLNDFHPHHNIEYKIYHYDLFIARPLPFYARFGTFIAYKFDVRMLEAALRLFVGTHNFKAFYTGNDRIDTIRTIDSITITSIFKGNGYRINVKGKKFLRHMIRRMIGAALMVSRDVLKPSDITYALKTGNIKYEMPTAPAQGLTLFRIKYKRIML